MDESKQNGHKDILLDRRQLDQVMKSINKQASHERYEYSDSHQSLKVEIEEFFGYVETSTLLSHLSNQKKINGDSKGLSLQAWIEQLLDRLESRHEERKQAAEQLLYIALGEYDQWTGDAKGQLDRMIKNNGLLYDRGVFHAIQQTLKQACNQLFHISDTESSLLVEIDLYLTLNYLILETNRHQGRFEKDSLDVDFLEYLFDILGRLKDNFMQAFPVKKLILLVWKTLLVTLGDLEKARSLKDELRAKNGLAPMKKSQVVKCSQRDFLTFQNDFLSRYPAYTPPINLNSPLDKVSPLTTKATPSLAAAMGISAATTQTTLPYQVLFPPKQSKGSSDNKQVGGNTQTNGTTINNDDSWNSSQTVVLPLSESGSCVPTSLNEASAIYQHYLQLSLTEYQIIMERQRAIQKWQDLERNGCEEPIVENIGKLSIGGSTTDVNGNHRSEDIFDRIEHLYASIIPELQGIVIVLLKQLLTTAASKPKTPGKNSQQKQQGIPTMEMADNDRNREILCKGISAILLLLLKWFKVSHALKFEYLSQLLVDSGCMLLILKIFGLQEINALTTVKNDVDAYSLFQQLASSHSNGSVYSSPPASPLSPHDESHYTNERNLFWIINLLRTLQTLSKGKMHRIMLLVQYKSSAIFKRVHKISHPMVELYALKNLKNQIPYLGRKWRSVNMKMISAIYFCCPPDLRDDWLITRNDKDGDLEEGKMEEINLRILIRLYHGQRYIHKLLPDDDSKHNDYLGEGGPFSASLVLDKDSLEDITLDESFKTDYRSWLEKEVYSKNDDDDEQTPVLTDWSIGTPIPTTEPSGISPALLAQEINKLYHEELEREFKLSKEITSGWDAPIEPTNIMGERVKSEDDDDEEDEDKDEKGPNPADPLENVDWSNLSEEELAKRLAMVEENTVRRWMNVDINDPQYIKVLNTFENVGDDPMNDVWGAVDPSLEPWS